MHLYKCDICGCYLDPGEGSRCEECIAEERRKARKFRTLTDMITVDTDGQYKMEEIEWYEERIAL